MGGRYRPPNIMLLEDRFCSSYSNAIKHDDDDDDDDKLESRVSSR